MTPRKKHRPPDSEGGKSCTKCGKTKPVAAFPPEPRNKCGLAAHCKVCRRVQEGEARQGPERRARELARQRTPEYRAVKLAIYYRRRDKALAQKRLYQQTPMGRLIHRRNAARYRLRHAGTPEGRLKAGVLVKAYDAAVERLRARMVREEAA